MPYESFHVPKTVTDAIRKRARMMVWGVGLTPILTILFLHFTKGKHDTSSLFSSLIPAVGLAVFIAWRYYRRMNQWQQDMSRYEVRVEAGKYISSSNPKGGSTTDATVLEDAKGLNWLTINKDDIGSIVHFEGQRVIITSKDGSTIIPLITKLSPFEELLDVLATLGPIEQKTGNQFILTKAISEYVPAIGLLIALVVVDPRLKLLGGVVALVGYGYQLYILNRINTGINNRRRMFIKGALFLGAILLTWSGLKAFFAG